MSTYVYMKFLESTPERYDAGIQRMSRGRIARVYQRIAELAADKGRRLLDIGCGTGVSLACAARGADVIGIDANAGMLEVARRKAAGATLAGSVEFIELDAMEIEDRFEPECFDAIVSCLVLSELLPEERGYVLKTARSRLKPGGLLVVADEVVPRSRWGRARHTLARLPRALVTYLLTKQSTRPVPDLASAMVAAGFAGVEEERMERDDFAVITATTGGAS
jgi:ubiquinone/menaquinone biosynthesis C-methylase UbiE